MAPHPLTNFEIQKYYQNQLSVKPTQRKFNGVFSRNNLPKTKAGAYVIILDEFIFIGTHWIDLYVNGDNVTYFDSFGVEYIPKEI